MGFDDRVLCVDGGCIGLVGPDGQCRECGKAGPKGSRVAAKSSNDDKVGGGSVAEYDDADEYEYDDEYDEYDDDEYDDDDDDSSDDDGSDEEDELGGFDELPKGADDFDARELCSDGACVGLIGKKGRCTTCGKPAGTGEEE